MNKEKALVYKSFHGNIKAIRYSESGEKEASVQINYDKFIRTIRHHTESLTVYEKEIQKGEF